jgi:hypothetical protein
LTKAGEAEGSYLAAVVDPVESNDVGDEVTPEQTATEPKHLIVEAAKPAAMLPAAVGKTGT